MISKEAIRAAEQATGTGEWFGKGAPGGTRTILGAALLATVDTLAATERERDALRERVADLTVIEANLRESCRIALASGSDKPAWCPLGNGGDGEPTTETRR